MRPFSIEAFMNDAKKELLMQSKRRMCRFIFKAGFLALWIGLAQHLPAQSLEKMRLAYSGTGLNRYVLEMGKRQGIFQRNGLDLEVIYVNSGSLLSQALIAGTFDVAFSQGSEAMLAKLRGADIRIAAVVANRFNHVYLAAPSITSFKQLKGKRVAVSRFGSGSHFQTNLALREGGLDPEKDVTVFQIGNSGARIAAILSGAVDGTIMAADFVPRAKREGLNLLADLADTKIEYPFLSLNMLGSYIDKHFRLVKALIKGMSESIRALQTDPVNAKIAIRTALKTDDHETIDYALTRSVQILARRPFPTPAGIQTVIDELGKETAGKNLKYEDYVDLRALRELDKEGAFK
jgi:ABC-type nitrate/sulfonate/bicarbonate transport system substrate-binding protein